MTAGRQGGVAEAAPRCWRTALGEHHDVTRQSLGPLIAACHVVILKLTNS